MAAGLFDYLTTVSDYLDSLESSLYKQIVAVIVYVDAVAVWSARAYLSLGTWSRQVDDAQLGVDNIVAQAFLGGVVKATADELRKLADRIWEILQNGEIVKLWKWVKKILSKLKRWAEWLRKYLQQLKKQIDWYYNTYIRPIMDRLQRIRRVLFLFRILGFKWARKLDQDIAKLEAKINQQFLLTQKAINQVIDWVTFITDPFGLFNPVIFALSAIKSIGDLFNALWQAQTFGLPSFPTTDQRADARKFSRDVTLSQFHETVTTGLLSDDRARVAALTKAFQGLGYAVK